MRKPALFVNALLLVCLLLGAMQLARRYFPAGDSSKPQPVRPRSVSRQTGTEQQARELKSRDDKAVWESTIRSSRSIIVARCVTTSYDAASFQILETVKGEKVSLSPLRLRYITLSPGREAIFFLPEQKPADNHLITPLRAVHIFTDTGNRKFVSPGLSGLPLFHAQDGSPYSNEPLSYPLEDFLFSLKKSS